MQMLKELLSCFLFQTTQLLRFSVSPSTNRGHLAIKEVAEFPFVNLHLNWFRDHTRLKTNKSQKRGKPTDLLQGTERAAWGRELQVDTDVTV